MTAPIPSSPASSPSSPSGPVRQPDSDTRSGSHRRRWLAVAVVTLLALIALTAFAGYRVGASGQTPANDSADAGFSRDMQTFVIS